jgi:hypothetical protein
MKLRVSGCYWSVKRSGYAIKLVLVPTCTISAFEQSRPAADASREVNGAVVA